jgi:acetyltransferase-like isoleucine patch superfamily enzyme
MSLLNKLCTTLEVFLSRRWYNPFATIWMNYRCLPFKQAVHLPISVYGRPKLFDLRGTIEFDCPIKRGMVEINNNHMAAPSYQGCQSEFLILGRVVFHGSGQIDTGVKVYVNTGALLEFGDRFKISDVVNVGCYSHISIGNMCRIAHRCQVMDTSYHYLADLNRNVIPSTVRPVKIGNYVWVGNSTTISAGAIIPDHTVVASNSVVNKNLNIPPYSIVGGIPAKFIKEGFRRVESHSLTQDLYQYYQKHSDVYALPSDVSEEVFLCE